MKKGVHYTVPLPDPVIPPDSLYADYFQSLPWIRRIILSFTARIRGTDTVRITRDFLLARLGESLDAHAGRYVDARKRILLPEFSREIRRLQYLSGRVSAVADNAASGGGGTFLRFTTRRLHPDLYRRCVSIAEPDQELIEQSAVPISEIADTCSDRLSGFLQEKKADVYLTLDEVWRAIVTLRVFLSAPFSVLTVDPRHPTVPVPIVTAATSLLRVYQSITAAYHYCTPVRLESAREYTESHTNAEDDVIGALYNGLALFLQRVPLLDIVRFAKGQPLMEISVPRIPVQWWESYEADWRKFASDRVPPRVLQGRFVHLREVISRIYQVPEVDSVRFPRSLYPRSLSVVRMLMDSERFQLSRKAVTQLVIDGIFHRIDLRNSLHQAILQLDRALERIIRLVGSGDSPGLLSEEEERVQRNSRSSSVARRRILSIHDRFRGQIIADLQAITTGLANAGEIVSMGVHNWADGTPPFELESHSRTKYPRERPFPEHLNLAGTNWPDLSAQLTALFEAEDSLRSYRRQ